MKKILIALAVLMAAGAQAQTATSQSQSASGASAGSNSGAAAIIYLDQSGPLSQTINGTQTLNANQHSTNVNTSTSTDNVNYSGKIVNEQTGTTTQNIVHSGQTTENTNVHYSGTQTVKNVPGIAMSGPASGPCTGASGGLGIAGPGFGVGLNGAKVEPSCVLRENIRVTGMAMQSLDGAANPQEKGALLVMMMDQMRGLAKMSEQIIQEHVKAK